MANETITLTTEQFEQLLDKHLQAALQAGETDAKSAIKSKAIDLAKDVAKDNFNETLFDSYKDVLKECVVDRAKEWSMAVLTELANLVFHNPMWAVLVVLLVCIAILFVSIRRYHKRMQARKGLAKRPRGIKHAVTEGALIG